MPAEEARAFLTAIWPDGAPGHLAVTRFRDRTPATSWFAGGDLDALARHAAAESAHGDVYLGCCSHATVPSEGRGSESSVLAVPGIWADVDVAHATAHKCPALPPTIGDALTLLDGLPVPSLIVSSGFGLHVWWLYREPWTIESEADRAAAKAVVQRVQAFLRDRAKRRGWTVDNTADLARILRVPGTRNHKTPDRPMAQIVDEDAVRYNPSDFDLLPESGTAGAAPREAPYVPASGDWGPREGQSRHDWLRGKAVALASAGVPVAGIAPALRAWADALPGERKTDAELRNLAESAVAKFGRPAAPDPETVEPLPYFTAATLPHRERSVPELLLPGVRLHGRTLIVAPSETGKTWFSLELGAKAAVGGRVCGEWQIARPVRVLGIFAEDDPGDLADRAEMLFAGNDLDPALLADNLRIVADPAFWFGDPVARARLFRLVADFRPELILADTVQATSDIKSFKDAEDVTRFYREHMAPLRAAAGGPCGLGLNHHTNKLAYAYDPTTDESGLIHGSDAFRRISDAVIFLRPAGDVPHLPAGGSAFVVSTNKQRVGRRRGSGKHLVFLWPDQTAVALGKPDHETPVALVYQRELSGDEAAKLTRRKRPADGLLTTLGASDVPLTKADLAARLGKKERTVDGYIAAHRAELELFVCDVDGTFRPATDADKSGKTKRPLAYRVPK
jgi:hypothetical protein